MEALEKRIENNFRNIDKKENSVDIYSNVIALYTPPPKPYGLLQDNNQFGLINGQPFQSGYDFPNTQTQLHLHGPDKNTITHGHIIPYGREEPLANLNGYDASMAAWRAELVGFKKFP